jgi:hypothetical protein
MNELNTVVEIRQYIKDYHAKHGGETKGLWKLKKDDLLKVAGQLAFKEKLSAPVATNLLDLPTDILDKIGKFVTEKPIFEACWVETDYRLRRAYDIDYITRELTDCFDEDEANERLQDYIDNEVYIMDYQQCDDILYEYGFQQALELYDIHNGIENAKIKGLSNAMVYWILRENIYIKEVRDDDEDSDDEY